jgi:hypothetical protein
MTPKLPQGPDQAVDHKFHHKPLPSIPKDISAVITPEQFSVTYKVVKKGTSSSLSGRHIGNYKAAATNLLLSELHSSMMGIPYMAGFSPSRWQQVVDVILGLMYLTSSIQVFQLVLVLNLEYLFLLHPGSCMSVKFSFVQEQCP